MAKSASSESATRVLWTNPLYKGIHKERRNIILGKFPEVAGCPHQGYLALWQYIEDCPTRFYCAHSKALYSDFLMNWCKEFENQLQRLLADVLPRIHISANVLSTINSESWHDSKQNQNEHRFIQFVDRTVCSTYLRLLEGPFFILVYIIANISRLKRGKSTEGLDLFNCVEELKKTPFSEIGKAYDNTIRNSIAHGNVHFDLSTVFFKDKKKNREESFDDFLCRTDDLLDICNGMMLALRVYYLLNPPVSGAPPRQFVIEELKAEVDMPWWGVEGCVESEFLKGIQLIIFINLTTREYLRAQYAGFMTAAFTELFAPGYDRYFLSMRTKRGAGWAGFDGKKLRDARLKNSANFLDYEGVLQDNLFFFLGYLKVPGFISRLRTLFTAFILNYPIAIEQIRESFSVPSFSFRLAECHRNKWGLVVNATVIVNQKNDQATIALIRNHKKTIIRKASAEAKKSKKLFSSLRWLPVIFARIIVFNCDFRQRRLGSFGLGRNLVGSLTFSIAPWIKCPDLIGSYVETNKAFRICWNKAWFEEDSTVKAELFRTERRNSQ